MSSKKEAKDYIHTFNHTFVAHSPYERFIVLSLSFHGVTFSPVANAWVTLFGVFPLCRFSSGEPWKRSCFWAASSLSLSGYPLLSEKYPCTRVSNSWMFFSFSRTSLNHRVFLDHTPFEVSENLGSFGNWIVGSFFLIPFLSLFIILSLLLWIFSHSSALSLSLPISHTLSPFLSHFHFSCSSHAIPFIPFSFSLFSSSSLPPFIHFLLLRISFLIWIEIYVFPFFTSCFFPYLVLFTPPTTSFLILFFRMQVFWVIPVRVVLPCERLFLWFNCIFVSAPGLHH